MRLPIRVRMTVWYVTLLGLIIAAVGAFLVLRLRTDLVAAMDRTLQPAAEQIALGYHAEGPPEAPDVSATVLAGEPAVSQVLTPAGRAVISYGDRVSRSPMISASDIRRALAGGQVQHTATLGPVRSRFRIVARTTTRGSYRRVIVVGESMAAVDRSVHRVLMLLLIAGPAALVATAAGGWWLARRSLRPVQRLTTEAQLIGRDQLAGQLAVPSTGDEVAQLAETLNTMLTRIQNGVEEQQRLIADASHELRSPLAAMRAELDVSLRADDLGPEAHEVLESARDEVDQLSRTVDGLLTLARADRGALDLTETALDLAAVAANATERVRPLACSRDITLESELSRAPVLGDAIGLSQAIGNLLDNAVKFSPRGATVRVTTEHDGSEAVFRVLDEGPGIPTASRERVFDRFFRLDASRTRATGGSGIGLSIVRETARAHSGRAWVEPGPAGGSLFVLALPAAPPERPG